MTRAQFLPVILTPILAGASLAWWSSRVFSTYLFGLVVLGSVAFHLAANTINDIYDFESGVDGTSNSMFPPDFGGWKILPRGMMSVSQAKLTAYGLFAVTIGVGLYLTLLKGLPVLILGAIGLFFAYFHVAQPLRLGYRGFGLSELGILLSFGILPVAGTFYVLSSYLSPVAMLVGVPLGLMTATVLINHDQIFYDAYKKSGKRSYTVTVGRRGGVITAAFLTFTSYLMILASIVWKSLPIHTAFVLLTLPLYIVQIQLYRAPAPSPLHYVKLTQTTFALSVLFGLLLAVGLFVS